MLEKLKSADFDLVFQMMEASFPSDEYRPYAQQKALLAHPMYQIYTLPEIDTHKIPSFISVWDLDSIAFIEHFAVDPGLRNGGLGAKVLRELMDSLGKRLCLEVELPDNELAARRIGFYKRNQFFLNPYPYVQPALAEGKKELPLLLMTTEGVMEPLEFQEIQRLVHTQVYQQK